SFILSPAVPCTSVPTRTSLSQSVPVSQLVPACPSPETYCFSVSLFQCFKAFQVFHAVSGCFRLFQGVSTCFISRLISARVNIDLKFVPRRVSLSIHFRRGSQSLGTTPAASAVW